MINVIFQATLTADPQQDTKNKSNSVHAYLNLAGKLGVADPNNSQYRKSLFMQGSVWGKLAETCMSNLKKGSKILVFGTLYDVNTNESNGKTYLNTSVNITGFEFLDSKSNAGGSTAQQAVQPMQNNPMGMPQQQQAPQVQQNMNNGEVQAPPWLQQGAAMAGGNNLAASFFG